MLGLGLGLDYGGLGHGFVGEVLANFIFVKI